MTSPEGLFKDEVVELTELLRTDASLDALRSLLENRGLRADETILAGLIDSEDMSQYGVLLTREARLVAFEIAPDGAVRRWDDVEDPRLLEADFQAVAVAVDLQRRGEIT
jgi:hypothetical protein